MRGGGERRCTVEMKKRFVLEFIEECFVVAAKVLLIESINMHGVQEMAP